MVDRLVKCSSCDVPAQVILEENIPQKVVCSHCGVSESYEDFLTIGWSPGISLCLQGIWQGL